MQYAAELRLVAFASRASRPVDLEALRVELLRVVSDTIQPAPARVCILGVR